MTTIEWGRVLEFLGQPAWLADDVLVKFNERLEPKPAGNLVLHGGRYRLPADHFAYRALDAGFEPWGGGDHAPKDWDWLMVLLRSGVRTSCINPRWTHLGKGTDIIGYRKRAEAPEAPEAPIDWSQPIEHIDGTPLVVRHGPDRDGVYLVARDDGELFDPLGNGEFGFTSYFNAKGEHLGVENRGPLIRNRAPKADGDTVTLKRMTEREWRERITAKTGLVENSRATNSTIRALRALGLVRKETETNAERFARETGHEVTPAVAAALAWRAGK